MKPCHHSSHDAIHACMCLQVQLMQREAELAESTSNAAAGSKAWQLEQARLQETVDKWQGQAVSLQAEVRTACRHHRTMFVRMFMPCGRRPYCVLGLHSCGVLYTIGWAMPCRESWRYIQGA
jgi:hypothetical protein